MLLKKLREEVLQMNLELPKNNLVTMTSGNVSSRDPETNYVVIKPSGVRYEDLKIEDLVIVDLTGKIVEGKLKPSVDTISHLVIYRNRKDICGIVHTHSPYATSFALLGKPLPVYMTAHADEFGDIIPIVRYASAYPLEDVGNAIVKTLGNKKIPAVLLKNHGVFAFGETPSAALKAAVMIEDIRKNIPFGTAKRKTISITKKRSKKWYHRYHTLYGQRR